MINSDDKIRELSIDDMEKVTGGTGETDDGEGDDDYVYFEVDTGTGYFHCYGCGVDFGGLSTDRNGRPCPQCGSTKTVHSDTTLGV
ncbi:MAG: hypothetical protein K6G22_00725 [Lachnospiraceae bacterium]|nr:hypothetical protein [Lachnospiraceae bacterium]